MRAALFIRNTAELSFRLTFTSAWRDTVGVMPHDSLPPLPEKFAERLGASVYGRAGSRELDALHADVERTRLEALSDPSKATDVLIAEKRRDLFLSEHDNAGAFKFKRFARELLADLEPNSGRRKALETDGEGRFKVAPTARERRMLFINMGELDRVNKEGGGHDAGDHALASTVRALEEVIVRQLGKKSTDYTILRYRGNEFMVSFNSVTEHDFQEIIHAARDIAPEVPGSTEPPPVVAEGFSFEETVDLLNQVQSELSPEERVDPSDRSAVVRELMDIMKMRADWSLDVQKFLSRVERVQEKLRKEGGPAATGFFDNYMRKTFAGTMLEDIKAFENLSKEEAESLAFAHASKALHAEANAASAIRSIIEARVADIGGRKGGASTRLRPFSAPVLLATIPTLTRGQRTVAEAGERADAAELSGDMKGAELARLDAQIEAARRDRGTGLLERGVYQEELERAILEGQPPAIVFVDMGFLRYFDSRGGPDVGDVALKLAASLMEQAIVDSGVDGEAYRYGGDEFTVQIRGGQAETEKFLASLETLRAAAGGVPPGKNGDRDGYVPTSLVFNAGAADAAIMEEVFKSLLEAGAYGSSDLATPESVARVKAELLTSIADRGIQRQKAVNRFLLLIEALRGGKMLRRQADDLITFSNKAIFAEAGGAELLQRLAESGKTDEEMIPEIEAWVERRAEESRKKEDAKSELLALLIETHGKLAYYERALSEARHDTEEQRAKYEQASKELELVREERRRIIEARRAVGPPGGEK